MNGGKLQRAIAELYAEPLDGFVPRRTELARELRTAGDRDGANVVKALRKPSRLAWALNAGVRRDADAFARLDAAAAATIAAQAGNGDVRAAMAELRAAVRAFAGVAAASAHDAGHPLETSALTNTVLAVLGRPESLEQLRNGQLVETPDGGGLDFLANLPAPPDSAPVSAPSAPAAVRDRAGDAARAMARRAADALAAAQREADVASQALQTAESDLAGAESRLRQAKDELIFARKRRDDARREADAAAAALASAEVAHDEAQRGVETASSG